MKKKFLLDTCSLSALKQPSANHHIRYVSKLTSLDDSDELYISMISIYEMEYGARHIRDKYPEMALEMKLAIQSIKDEFIILNLTDEGAIIFADIKEQYQTKKGVGKSNISEQLFEVLVFLQKTKTSNTFKCWSSQAHSNLRAKYPTSFSKKLGF